MEQISAAMTNTNQATQQAAQHLSALADRLNERVARYRLVPGRPETTMVSTVVNGAGASWR